jgi:hypothetical protein
MTLQLLPELIESIKGSTNPTPLLDEISLVSHISLEERLTNLKKTVDENDTRMWLTNSTFTVTVLWLIFVAGVFVCYGKRIIYIPDGVMITFLTTTTANTFGFLLIIFRYLFYKEKDPIN